MSMSQERDTHFAGFAELLWREVRKTSFDSPGFSEYQQLERHLQLLFARRAYDLAEYVINLIPDLVQAFPDVQTTQEVVSKIPDMAAWPDEPRGV